MNDMRVEGKLLDDIIGWDTGTWSHAIEFWKPALQASNAGDWGVEIGAHAGGLSLLFALNGINAICTDISNPSELCDPVHNRYEEGRFITYLTADATSLPFRSGTISYVGSKSVLGSIARDGNYQMAQKTINEVYRVLKPGGYFLFAENLTGSRMHMLLRRRFVPWAKHYYYFTRAEIGDLLSPFSQFDFATRGFMALTGRNESQRRALAKLDKLIHPVTPKTWRYLAYGYARK